MNQKKIKLAAHRGACGGNIPCNSLQAFSLALRQGAEIVELDVEMSRDGVLFVQHPGMEKVHLRLWDSMRLLPADVIEKLSLSNCDLLPTDQHPLRLEQALQFLKGKCTVNIDKFWDHPKEISDMVRALGMEQQVLIKTGLKEKYLEDVEKYAPDIPFMSVAKNCDTSAELLKNRKIHWVGTEVLFAEDSAPVADKAYIESMNAAGKFVWVNALVYNYKTVLAGGHNDDISMLESEERGWGWLASRGFDIIQTDFLLPCRMYLEKNGYR